MASPDFAEFFRANTRELPDVAEKWFSLSNGQDLIRELIKQHGRQRFVQMYTAGQIEPRPEIMMGNLQPETQKFIEDFVAQTQTHQAAGRYWEAISYANERLTVADGLTPEIEARGARHRVYYYRGDSQAKMVTDGPLKDLPFGDKTKVLGFLSATTDYMRADIERDLMSDVGHRIAEGFANASMFMLQRRVFSSMMGQDVTAMVSSDDRIGFSPKVSVPADPEIAGIQRAITARIQGRL